ncbi:MAG: Inosine/xanthosine triphosphatase [Chlamydiae bacterium]|nr:Inosine/xanthosine triphosphatase [Chlamydiota bacterium]
MTILVIGTKNKAKIQALNESLEEINLFKDYSVESLPVSSEVAEQPLSLEATIQGAKNRARNAFDKFHITPQYGVGVESGLIEASETQTGFLHISVCCIYDGTQSHIGSSTGFEIPPNILKKVIEEKLDLSQACVATGISSNANIGSEEGLIGILTNGKTNRMRYTQECIDATLLQLQHKSWYTQPMVSR